MKISKEKFESILKKFGSRTQKVYAAIRGLSQSFDYNSGDKSMTQLAIYPTESIELTTREGWDSINIIYFSSTENEDDINRDAMGDKPQFILTVNIETKVMSVTPYHGCDDNIEAKVQTLKDMLTSALEEV